MKKTLLLVLISLIIGFFIGKSVNNTPVNDVEPSLALHPEIVRFFSEPVLGTLDIEIDPSYFSTIIDAEPLWSLPEQPSDDLPTGNMSGIKPFDENEGAYDLTLISDWKIKNIDINDDGVDEKVMTNSIGIGSAPQLVRIVKDDMVIFEHVESVVGIEEAYYKDGFILTTEVWQDKNGKRIRYIIEEDGTIVPLWQQRHAGIKIY